jgi:hypothetical protein
MVLAEDTSEVATGKEDSSRSIVALYACFWKYRLAMSRADAGKYIKGVILGCSTYLLQNEVQ